MSKTFSITFDYKKSVYWYMFCVYVYKKSLRVAALILCFVVKNNNNISKLF